MNIIIAGGGPGGLAAAIALAQTGHRVTVMERTAKPTVVGAGISLQPNAMQALALLGLEKEIGKLGCPSSAAHLFSSNGKSRQEFDFSNHVEIYGHLPHTIHRADLYDVLHHAAIESGVEIQYGQTFDKFEIKGDLVLITTDTGAKFAGDCLIGADGIRSRVRAQLWGDQPTRYSGYVCWRGIVQDPVIVESVTTMSEIWGRASRFGYMRCSPGKVYWFATLSIKQSAMHAKLSNNTWKDHYRFWPDPVARLIENTPVAQVNFNDIHDRKPIDRWGKGNVTLLGDAAHPMTPNFGQGGAQAIEDGIVLAKALKDSRSTNLSNDLRRYEDHRHPRTAAFVNESRQFGRIGQGGNWIWRFLRNNVLPLVPDSVVHKSLSRQFQFLEHLDQFDSRGT